MRHLCLILMLTFSPLLTFSQLIGDTVILYVDAKVEIKIAIPDFEELKTSDSIKLALYDFKKFIPAIGNNLTADKAELIKYKVGGELSIEPGEEKIIFFNEDDKLTNTGIRDQAILFGDKYTIYITTTDITHINNLDLVACVEKMNEQLPDKIRWSKSLIYDCSEDEVKMIEEENHRLDMLGIQLGAGAGLIKSKWVADLSFGLNLSLNHKGIPRGPYVSTNLIFDFDAEDNLNINTFLNVGYSFNVGNKTKKPDMLGVELGYLISKQGNLFGDNTFKLGVNWSPAKYMSVTPALYITDNFKQAFPGIRIGFGI